MLARRKAPRLHWEPTACEVPGNRAHAIERFREILFDSIRIRLRSDVPVGSSLSGGIDSSSIVSTINAQKTVQWLHQKTFSARFHSQRRTTLGRFIKVVTHRVEAETREVWVEPEQFIDAFERLQTTRKNRWRAPAFAQWLVMQLARKNDFRPSSSMAGRRRILAGYDQAGGMFLAHWLRRGRPDKVDGSFPPTAADTAAFASRPLRRLLLAPRDSATASSNATTAPPRSSPRSCIEFAPGHVDGPSPFPDRLRNELVRWQTTTQLPEFLRYADRNSMAFSREVRLPFLDHRLAEYAFGLPPDLLLKGATTKVVLRESMRSIVPMASSIGKTSLPMRPAAPVEPWPAARLDPRKTPERRAAGKSSTETVRGSRRFDSGGDDTLAWPDRER
ncbi:MAG: hypothetical protein IPH65_17745 [Dehalococcoidia bacterium]|uniref:asparagine synthase-related protein n=1 Tax=Candidatus Amarobacter glycogenicus TaxID=3140699 RepID=UPI0031358CED|nr:hypothetical protein [Dehalococcoidia bacterium]